MSDAGLETLCYVHELLDPGSKGFSISGKQLFAVRWRQKIYVYVNRCPHVQIPLNWIPDQFFDRDKELIQCSGHGALFQIDTGICVAGPCPGKRLEAVPFEISDGKISVATNTINRIQ